MAGVPDEDEVRRLTEDLEARLRAYRAGPGRCCHTDCLHCPYGGPDGAVTRPPVESTHVSAGTA